MPPAYADAGVRQSRSRLDYDYGAGASQYGDAYDSRFVRCPNPWNTGIEMIYSENRQKGKNRLSAT